MVYAAIVDAFSPTPKNTLPPPSLILSSLYGAEISVIDVIGAAWSQVRLRLLRCLITRRTVSYGFSPLVFPSHFLYFSISPYVAASLFSYFTIFLHMSTCAHTLMLLTTVTGMDQYGPLRDVFMPLCIFQCYCMGL